MVVGGEIQGMSDIFLITMTTEESICRGMSLAGFGEYVYIGECDSFHMFASQNSESRLTFTYAMTLSFHPWNEVGYFPLFACAGEKSNRYLGDLFILFKKRIVFMHISICLQI